MPINIFSNLRPAAVAMILVALLAALAIWGSPAWSGHGRSGPMPEFTTTSENLWVNSKPLKKADLEGKVLLLEVWTSI